MVVDAEQETEAMMQARLRAEARRQAARDFLQGNPLVGLRADEARQRVRAAGIPFRAADAAEPILSADLRPGRITTLVKDGIVVSAEVGK